MAATVRSKLFWTAILGLLAGASVTSSCIASSGTCSGDGVTTCQISQHAEAKLVYPGSRTVRNSVKGESSGDNFIEPTGPTPARVDVEFTTRDTPDKVIAWYDGWLKAHRWADTGPYGGRSWQRGDREVFVIDVPVYRHDLPADVVTYDYSYVLYSSRFAPLSPALPAIRDPVSVEDVTTRNVGITKYGRDEYRYGTIEAAFAEKSLWPSNGSIYSAILITESQDSEESQPARAAYRLRALEVPEYYDQPQEQVSDQRGHLLTEQKTRMYEEGFRLLSESATTLIGTSAVELKYGREDREVYTVAIAYGPDLKATYPRTGYADTGSFTAPYRVATIAVAYAILPKSCTVTRNECLALVPDLSSAFSPKNQPITAGLAAVDSNHLPLSTTSAFALVLRQIHAAASNDNLRRDP
jgi:hypothetical protein